MSELEKPFWAHPPYAVLFNLLRLHRIRPWDVNIALLLNAFLAEMKKRGHIDFSASGTALLSSSILHRMKSELVLKMEEPPKPPAPKPQETVPPPLPLPIRYEHVTTSVEQILNALKEVLESERFVLAEKERPVLAQVSVLKQVDEFLANIEEHVKEFYSMLQKISSKRRTVSFKKLIENLSFLEIVRRFIMLLFLACQDKVRLVQEEEFGDIVISILPETPKIAAT